MTMMMMKQKVVHLPPAAVLAGIEIGGGRQQSWLKYDYCWRIYFYLCHDWPGQKLVVSSFLYRSTIYTRYASNKFVGQSIDQRILNAVVFWGWSWRWRRRRRRRWLLLEVSDSSKCFACLNYNNYGQLSRVVAVDTQTRDNKNRLLAGDATVLAATRFGIDVAQNESDCH